MKVLRLVLLMGMVALAPAVAWAFTPGAGIKDTPHDFTSGGTKEWGVCTFCHTPHKAISTLLLWNHALSKNPIFKWDVPSTTAGTTFPQFANTYNGPTAKCLSCHDGSVAIGDVAWFKEGKPASPLDSTTHGAGDPANIGLGGDMSGNHPVAMPYPYQQAKNTYNAITTGNAITLAEWQGDPTTLGIRLFNSVGGSITAGPVAGQTGIECSSCHEPHNGSTVKDDLFLRGKIGGNDTNYICLKCHIK